MSIKSTTPLGLPRIIVPKRHVDDRGWFSESFHKRRLHDIGITCDFVQDNQSSTKLAGTLRGLHFQLPPAAQDKLVIVVRGRVLDVVVDARLGSPTFGQYVSVELSAESGRQLYVPVGFAHGFLTLEDDVVVIYKVSHHYSASHDSGLRWNDPDVGFPWQVKDANVIISDKDRKLPYLKGFVSPFHYDGQPLAPLTVTNLG
jgi:dTDP-4-dehydrorhamnose 3,5-epimerase